MGYIHAQPEMFVNSTNHVLAHLVLQTQSECEAGPALEVLWLLPKALGFSSALRLRSSRGDVAPRQNPTTSPGEPLILGNSEPEIDSQVLCTPAWRAAQGRGRTRESQSMGGCSTIAPGCSPVGAGRVVQCGQEGWDRERETGSRPLSWPAWRGLPV